ncbi:MAG: branched-chain amino acid ABC transporter permease [Nitrospirota bacterium]|nr:branched-chain amino acid ABC transporter permease [Nitrospirota bacterium]
MSSLRQAIKRHGSFFLVPLWAGILCAPFTGIAAATRIALVLAAGVLLAAALRTGTITRLAHTLFSGSARMQGAGRRLVALLAAPPSAFLFLAALCVIPLFQNDYYRDVLTLTGMYVVLALGLNLVVGQAGLLNLGYVAFYAVGAYTYAISSTRFGLPFWPGMAAGAAVAALAALLIGLSTLKLRGDYFAIVTLGLGEITRIVLNNWDSVTGGPNGISRIPRPSLAGYVLKTPLDFYYLILLMVVITVFAMRRIIASRIGRAWIAIREDEVAAEAMGINTFKLKLLAFVIASALAGCVGVFFAAKMAFVSPESFTFFESVLILCMVVLGGMGSIPGIILGAVLLVMLPEIFRDFQDYRMIGFGIALVLMMIFRPQGLMGAGKRQ